MRRFFIIQAALLLVVVFSFATHDSQAYPFPIAIPSVDLIYPVIENQLFTPRDLPGSELTNQGRNVRGIYLPVGVVVTTKPEKLVRWVKEHVHANAVIIDVKDDKGRVTFSREVPGAKRNGHGFIPQMEKLVRRFQEEGIYVIGRLVCFKDDRFPLARPAASTLDTRSNKLWTTQKGNYWIDPYSQDGHDYLTAVAVAARNLGFDEIQLDYIRFPVEPATKYAWYSNRQGRTPRYKAIATLLAKMDRAIDIPLSIDVFGLTAYHKGDKNGLGQSLEHLAPYVDAISPMLYLANWPIDVWQNPRPSRTRAMVHNAILRLRKRLGDHIAIRPLLQGFRYRAHNFGVDFIENQIEASTSAGSSGYLFWNQSGKYGPVANAWRRQIVPHILTPKPAI